jgi:DNA-binding NtrC family response regulator
MKICIIDDEVAVTESLKDILTEGGFEIFTLNDPRYAMSFINNNNPDCLLLDIKMPTIDGLDLLKQIKKEYENLPIIMLSGHADTTSISLALTLGAANFLSKPWDNEIIKKVIKEVIKEGK